jgi:hypothetical protein
MQKSVLIVIVILLISVVSLSVVLFTSPKANPLQKNSHSTNTPTPTPMSLSSSSPSPQPSASSALPTQVSVPVPSFTLTQTIGSGINSATGASYQFICAEVTIKNEPIVKHFEVEYKGHYGDSWIPVTFDLEKSNTEYTTILSNWLPDGTYDFQVRAFDASGAFQGTSGDWSPPQTILITGN